LLAGLRNYASHYGLPPKCILGGDQNSKLTFLGAAGAGWPALPYMAANQCWLQGGRGQKKGEDGGRVDCLAWDGSKQDWLSTHVSIQNRIPKPILPTSPIEETAWVFTLSLGRSLEPCPHSLCG
jgi:hypothetical protein